jgi:hypothetical protein
MELGFVLREFPLWVDSFATRSEGFARLGEKWSCAGTVAVSLSLSKDEAVTEEREEVSRINCRLPGQPARSGKEEKRVSSAAYEW